MKDYKRLVAVPSPNEIDPEHHMFAEIVARLIQKLKELGKDETSS